MSTPIITPISVNQPGLLQVEPNGPLQKVDANIDTEQICKLIESLGNVQKVNQVVILGQVPPNAPPLEVQQIPQLAVPGHLNLNPTQIDFMVLKQADSKTVEMYPSNNPCDPMEQTIILEPITPDGQLENPSFSEMGSHIAGGENTDLTLVQSEQTEKPAGEDLHQTLQPPNISAVQSGTLDQMVCQNEGDVLKHNLEETVILELTPALMPIVELEQAHPVPQDEIPPTVLAPSTEMEKIPEQTVVVEQETGFSVPSPLHTVELELTPLPTDQEELPPCPVVPLDTLTQIPSQSETNPKEEVDSHMQTEGLDEVHPNGQGGTTSQETTAQEASEMLLAAGKEVQEQVENVSEVGEPSTKELVLADKAETKQVPPTTQFPLNVMSAQELVKVRKRKPARAFIFQGHMQELMGSIHKDDFRINATPTKRQRTKKSHLVVKFSTQSKEKKNKEKTSSQQRKQVQVDLMGGTSSTANLSEKKVPMQKKGRKGKKDRKTEHHGPSATEDPQVQKIKEDTKRNKMKKQKEMAIDSLKHISGDKNVASPAFRKKKQAKTMRKDQPKNAKDGKGKNKLKETDKTSLAVVDIPKPHLSQDALHLLKGHKQPQLKVYKLDTSKTSGQTVEASLHKSQTLCQQSQGSKLPASESPNNLTADAKKKAGRPKKNQKALSLLSLLQVSHQPTETNQATKPKPARKRKASSRVETEGVITSSHSKRALECNKCGERFSEVSSLQRHKVTLHVVESTGLTYTNGNIFEGVSRSDLFQLPKHPKVVGVMSATTDWDTEPENGEMAMEDREPNLSFPALIPSPSLPTPPLDVEMSASLDKDVSRTGADDQSQPCTSPSDQRKNKKAPQTQKHLTSGEDKEEIDALKTPGSEAQIRGTTDEDIKEDLLLEVDLVTVGEQNVREDLAPREDTVPQNESNGTCSAEAGDPRHAGNETGENSLTLHTVSCSTHQVEIKVEEEEILVHRKKGGKGGTATNPTRRKTGCPGDKTSKRNLAGDTVKEADSEKDTQDCQVVYEKLGTFPESEINAENEAGPKNSKSETVPNDEDNKATAPATSPPSTFEEFPEGQVVFELKSVTTSVDGVIDERGLQGGEEHDRDQSPGIILEKFLTSRQQTSANKELCLMRARNNQRQVSC